MIPISLTIEGLYSYTERQTIDFEPLLSSGLFGIFGPVGSGKSSILEAITFCLFGETERINSREARSYNMMNLRKNEIFIEFRFKTGDPEEIYSCAVSGKRSRTHFERIDKFERSAFRMQNGNREPIELEAIPEIIGLNYRNFRRTIIIPQGKFQEFLQLGDSDRRAMMKELFGLQKFELSAKTKRLEDLSRNEYDYTKGKLAGIGEITQEQIDSLQKEREKIQIELTEAEIGLEKAKAEISRLDQLKIRILKRESLNNELNKLIEGFALIESEIKQLERFEACFFRFHSLISNLDEANKQLLKQNESLANQEENLRLIYHRKDEIEQDISLISQVFNNREQLRLQASEIEKIAGFIQQKKQLDELENRVGNGVKFLAKETEQLNDIQLKLKEKQIEIANLTLHEPDLDQLYAIKDWFRNNSAFLKQETETQNERSKLTDRNTEINKNICEIIENSGIDISEVQTSGLEHSFEIKIQNLTSELNALEEKYESKKASLVLRDFSDNLIEGQACPLCGSRHHPQKFEAIDTTILIEKEKQKITELKKEIDTCKEFKNRVKHEERDFNRNEEILIQLTGKISDIGKVISNHQNSFIWTEYQGIGEIRTEELLKEAGELKIKINQARNDQSELSKKLETLSKGHRDAEELLNKLRGDFQTTLAVYNNEYSKLNHENLHQFSLHTEMELIELAANQRKEIDETIEKHEKLNFEKQSIEVNINQLVGRSNEIRDSIRNLQGQINETKTEIENRLPESGFNTEAEVINILSAPPDRIAIRQKADEFFRKKELCENELLKLNTEIGTETLNPDAHSEISKKADQLASERSEKSEQLGAIKLNISNKQESLQQSTRLKSQLTQIENRLKDIEVLKSLFKANGFVDYVSTVYLQNLCRSANERFSRLTRQQLRLQINQNNNFEVVDYLNGGKTRSIKTLSGGQTFQAALSLALALSDGLRLVSHSDKSFFFLDEGFGSLDRESLETVFNTLKSLRKENRIVGIISHVDEMQQEVSSFLKISLDPERGSQIQFSG